MGSFTEFFRHLDLDGLLWLVVQALAVLICLTVHETCHGLAALALGDPTAKRAHRLSFNPLRHIDPFGAVMMLTVGFGWARPVPVDMRYFKHPKSGMALTALAGPASNMVLAYAALLLRAALTAISYHAVPGGSGVLDRFLDFLLITATLSVGLGIFNLIPFPPLDGAKIVGGLLPDRAYYGIMRYERLGTLALMLLLWSGVLDGPLDAARSWVFDLLFRSSSFPFYWLQSLLA